MNRLTKTTASALLLVLMAAAPAAAMYIPGAENIPSEPGTVRIMNTMAPSVEPIYHVMPVKGEPILINAPVGEKVFAVPATRPAPISILIENTSISYDQQPIVTAGTLMVPLRAIVEGAGGQVTWDEATQTATVRIGDRTAIFVVGQAEAEMNQDGVRYIQRNMIKMAKAPVLEGSRTLVAADALTSVLGLMEMPVAEGALNLVPVNKIQQLPVIEEPSAPAIDEQEWSVTGTIKETREIKGGVSILVAGPALENGEANLFWFNVSANTTITVDENGAQREGTAADFAIAQKVDVKHDGVMTRSLPPQGRAMSVVIHK